nr:hypothetical protein [Microbacterium sp. RURRCA19A]
MHEDHAAVGVGFESAPPAPDRALEVVIVLASALAGVAARVEQFLHAVEEFHVDECFVATLVVLAPIPHLAQVVAVAEHLVDLGVRDGAGWPAGGRPGQESPVGELVGDVLEGHLAAGVEVEGELHERCSLFVDRDRVDLAPLDVVGDVEVAQRCST